MATISYDAGLFLVGGTETDRAAPPAIRRGPRESLLTRFLNAIDRSNQVRAADGKVYLILPPF